MKPSSDAGGGADPERLAGRAAALLARPGAWLDAAGEGYAVRGAVDRRRRPLLGLDEAAFRVLVDHPGLSPREEGGWRLRRVSPRAAPTQLPSPGRPGVTPGRRTVVDADGRARSQAVNLGESPLAWLARRRDAQGRPWLTPAEVAAAERLRKDVERSGLIGRLTMSWDGQPRARGGRATGVEPAERARSAKARVDAALEAVGPGLRDMLERICLTGSALEAAERDLALPRRAGKTVLKLALQRLAAHYRLG